MNTTGAGQAGQHAASPSAVGTKPGARARPQPDWLWLRCAGTTAGLQAVLGGIVYFLYDYPWLAALAGVLLFPGAWLAAQPMRRSPGRQVAAAAVVGQLPGLAGTLNVALEQARVYPHSPLGDIVDFVMETWHTALLPWLRLLPSELIPTRSGEELAPFFLVTAVLSPLLVIWTVVAARWPSAPRHPRFQQQDGFGSAQRTCQVDVTGE